VAYRGLRKALRHQYPVVTEKVTPWWRCTTSRKKAHATHRYAKTLRLWRKSYPQVWAIRFHRLSAADQGWARSTSSCEAGMNPATNTGNGFEGAFQFLNSTWHSAGGVGHAYQTTWEHQAVIAVNWRNVAGRGQWPVCG
jgi:hypothetical protein